MGCTIMDTVSSSRYQAKYEQQSGEVTHVEAVNMLAEAPSNVKLEQIHFSEMKQIKKKFKLQLPELDKKQSNNEIEFKDREISLAIESILKQQEIIISRQETRRHILSKIIGQLIFRVSQQAFYGYSNKKLNESECKVFFSNNLILNTINILQFFYTKFYEENFNTTTRQMFSIINEIEEEQKQCLKYQHNKYPQKNNQSYDPQIVKIILQQKDSSPQHYILDNLKIYFEWNKKQQFHFTHYRNIKLLINKLYRQAKANMERFTTLMKQAFTVVKFVPSYYNNSINNKRQQKYEIQSYKIANKFVSESQPFFNVQQEGIRIKSPQVLRILIKWIQQLEEMIQDPRQFIFQRQFLTKKGDKVNYLPSQKEFMIEQFEKYFLSKKNQKQQYIQFVKGMISLIPWYLDSNMAIFQRIPQNTAQVGLTSHMLARIISDISVRYLNWLINLILGAQDHVAWLMRMQKQNQQKDQNQKLKDQELTEQIQVKYQRYEKNKAYKKYQQPYYQQTLKKIQSKKIRQKFPFQYWYTTGQILLSSSNNTFQRNQFSLINLSKYFLRPESQLLKQVQEEIIDEIVTIQKRLRLEQSSKMKNQEKIYLIDQVSLLIIRVNDILRCKCAGTIEQITQVYRNLKKIEQQKFIKIISIKNRLNTGNMDFLIKMHLLGTSLLCEMQLGLKGNKDTKNQFLDHFNHFLYELSRSKYGPFTEAGILNNHLDPSIKYFQQTLKNKKYSYITREELKNLQIRLVQIQKPQNNQFYAFQSEGYTTLNNDFTFICYNCKQIKQPYKSFVNILQSNKNSLIKYCGECILYKLEKNIKQKYLLQKSLNQYQYQTLEQISTSQLQPQQYYLILQKTFPKKIPFLWYYYGEQGFIPCNVNHRQIKASDIKNLKQMNIFCIYRLKSTQHFEKTILSKQEFEEQQEKYPQRIIPYQIALNCFIIKQYSVKMELYTFSKSKQKQYDDIYKMKKQNKMIEELSKLTSKKEAILNKGMTTKFLCINNKKKNVLVWLVYSPEMYEKCVNQEKAKVILERKLSMYKQGVTQVSLRNQAIMDSPKLSDFLLKHSKSLTTLELQNNRLQDMQRLNIRSLEKLIHLNLQNNNIMLFSMSYTVKSLKYLNIAYNNIKEICYVKDFLNNLKIFKANNNLLDEFAIAVEDNNGSQLCGQFQNLEQLDLGNQETKQNCNKNSFKQEIVFSCRNKFNKLKVLKIGGGYSVNTQNLFMKELVELVITEHRQANNFIVKIPSIKNQTGFLQKLSIFRLTNSPEIQTIQFQPSLTSSLKELDLSGNSLISFQLKKYNLSSLEFLNLSKNKLTEFHKGELKSLKKLNLSTNVLDHFELKTLKMENLESLDLSNNQYLALELDLITLPILKSLYLNGNLLTELKLHNVTKQLEYLYLDNNLIEDMKQIILEPMCRIKKLHLRNNNLTKVDLTDDNFKSLNHLHLNENQKLEEIVIDENKSIVIFLVTELSEQEFERYNELKGVLEIKQIFQRELGRKVNRENIERIMLRFKDTKVAIL